MQRKINITLPLIRCIKENPLIRKTATLNMLKLSSLNKSIQKHNNLMGCQPYTKHRFR